MGETILLALSARSFGEGNMKAGVTLSKIFSTSIALLMCSAVLVFALMALCWGAALPAHAKAQAPSFGINPSHGATGTTITASGNGIVNSSNQPLSSTLITFEYSGNSDCSSPT